METTERRDATLRLDQRLRAETDLYQAQIRRPRRGPIAAAIVAAVASHAALLLAPIRLPAREPPRTALGPAGRAEPHAIIPSPAHLSLTAASSSESRSGDADARERVAPSAVPPAPPLDPVSDDRLDLATGPLPADAEFLLGVPEPPPARAEPPEPMGASDPLLLPQTRVPPVYPERARRLRLAGAAVLRVQVLPSGAVGEMEAIRCEPPGEGFCESAMAAVKRWRYRPASMGGAEVTAWVTVSVKFEAGR